MCSFNPKMKWIEIIKLDISFILKIRFRGKLCLGTIVSRRLSKQNSQCLSDEGRYSVDWCFRRYSYALGWVCLHQSIKPLIFCHFSSLLNGCFILFFGILSWKCAKMCRRDPMEQVLKKQKLLDQIPFLFFSEYGHILHPRIFCVIFFYSFF